MKFCASPENANQIAINLVNEARKHSMSLSSPLARLHYGRDEYRLDFMAVVDLQTVKRRLIEMAAEIDDVLSAYAPSEASPVTLLHAAE